MTHIVYLALLIGAIVCMGLIDQRYKLAFFLDKKSTIVTVIIGVLFFTAWDITGIILGVFAHGKTPWTLPWLIAPQFPLEELIFLTHLSYTTLVIYKGMEKICSRTP